MFFTIANDVEVIKVTYTVPKSSGSSWVVTCRGMDCVLAGEDNLLDFINEQLQSQNAEFLEHLEVKTNFCNSFRSSIENNCSEFYTPAHLSMPSEFSAGVNPANGILPPEINGCGAGGLGSESGSSH